MSAQLELDRTPAWERNMNPEQLEAIRHQDGPCQLLAQAGCHRVGTRILMADGRTEAVEDIEVGDRLMGPAGVARTVLSLCRGEGRMYRIMPTKGEAFVVNEDHVLTLVETSTDAVVDVTVREWLGWSGWRKANHKLFRVGVDCFEGHWERRYPVDPYLLGVLLGDGSIVKSVGVTSFDPEIRDYVYRAAAELGLEVRVDGDGGSTTTFTLTARNGAGKGADRNPLIEALRELDLYGRKSGNKFIPDCYLRAPRDVRLQVLAGLIDTDGSLGEGGGFDFITKSEDLAEGVLFLARSCGLAAYQRECFKCDQHGAGGHYQRIHISGHLDTVPTKVARKQAPARGQKKNVLRTGMTVEMLGIEKFYGFTLDFDGRYVMGDFTVTHNSGKTRALVHRVARMVAEGVPADRILAVTFSKKAADEMNNRLRQLGVEDARVGTWHSVCLQILKESRSVWGVWAVSKEGAEKLLVKEVTSYKQLDWKQADAGKLVRFIGVCKAHLAAPGSDLAKHLAIKTMFGEGVADAVRADGTTDGHLGPRNVRDLGLMMETYRLFEVLREERLMLTFDDFLVYVDRLFREQEHTRAAWSARWDYVLVDEYQDDNPAQVAIEVHLAKDHQNIMAVGDVAQSIYGFRGSSPEHLSGFAQRWPGSKVIVMNRNYRSGDAIVQVANDIIRPAAVRIEVDMRAERGAKGEVRCNEAVDQDEEGAAFAAWVFDRVNSGQPLQSICALFRTNAQSRALEEALLKKRVPYVIVGGTSFYERREVKGLLSYLRVAAGRDDDGESVAKCINAPFRYLGKAFVEKLGRVREGVDWAARVLRAADSTVQQRQRVSAQEWARLIHGIAGAMAAWDSENEAERDASKPAAILTALIKETGYIEWLEKDEGDAGIESSHSANVREMVRIAERFDTCTELLDYIDDMGRASRKQRGDKQAGGDRVLLMSIHRSKGLEWPNVWVNGCNEQVLPHHKGDPEEERRLMYVAATRARDSLVFSYVQQFATREGIRQADPSRFLAEAGLV